MGIHKDFPKSPYEILDPEVRWFPADESLREKVYAKLLPPLVVLLRKKVKEWRDSNYQGATETSKALLNYWFETEHPQQKADGTTFNFRYYFSQREAVETIVYLHDVEEIKDKYDLMRFDSSGIVSAGMFSETWKRFVIKMATGSGKTKVLSLLIAWSYYNKVYEEDSDLSRNFLLITPNIIVLDRLKTDFEGLKIFYSDPIIPPNGYCDMNWEDDFQLTIHLQDNVNITRKLGNIFLTNIHRVFEGNNKEPSKDDEDLTNYFLGKKPVGATNESKIDLGIIVRDIDELMILNDEAHHIHDNELAWFKSIEDIHNNLLQKESFLSMQIDVTATPRDKHGSIFVQTVSDYPLVEAIYQDVVKQPIVPDSASKAKLSEKQSAKYSERFQDYIHLGHEEWKKVYNEQSKLGKKAVFFLMTDDTRNCDEVAAYLEKTYPEFKDATLVIHTKENGEISEASTGKNKEELEKLRKAANTIDSWENKYKAIVSVLMLKEGWDVQNVTTIVGLRAYSSESNILPEQTLGRGLRRMYRGREDIQEYVSIIGTEPFMEFVSAIKDEGVIIEKKAMGEGTPPRTNFVVEIDKQNVKKDINKLDIEIPVLTPRIIREYKNLSELNEANFGNKKIKIKQFSEEEKRKIRFIYVITKENDENSYHHDLILDINSQIDYTNVIGFFTKEIMHELRLISGYDLLYEKVQKFITKNLFDKEVQLTDLNILRNLSELEVSKTIIETFKQQINKLTVLDKGEAEIKDYIKISKCKPFPVRDQAYLVPKKSVFNKIIGDSHLELEFAGFLETCEDIISYVKNYLGVHFYIDYTNSEGAISAYYPDFIVKKTEKEYYIVETKGLEDLDTPLKVNRLKQWCEDINKIQKKVKYDFIFVDEEAFTKRKPKNFDELAKVFKKYKN